MLMLRLLATAAALLVSPALLAQDFPGKTVRIVVPYPPGGGVDNVARPIAERLTQRWGHPVVIENKPGAATLIGTEFVVRSTPDGTTLLLTSDSTVTSNPHIYPKQPYDSLKDLAPVTQLASLPQMVVAHPSVEINSMAELVTLARAKPNTLNYGSYGSGSQPHLLFEGLRAQTGIAITQVPYKGIAPAVTATLAGEVQFTMAGASVARGHIQAGKLKPLAIARRERLAIMPNVPTLAEAGYAQLDPQAWFGILAPAGTPAAIVKRIRDDVATLFADAEFRDRHMIQRGLDPVLSTPEEFARFIQADFQQKGRLIKTAGVKAE